MLDGNWRAVVDRGLTPIGRSLRRTGISADVITVIGIMMATGAAVSIGLGYLRLGFLMLVLTGIPDALDGAVAKASGTASSRGAFFDSVADRLTDALLFGGVAWHLASTSESHIMMLPVAIMGTAMTTPSMSTAMMNISFRFVFILTTRSLGTPFSIGLRTLLTRRESVYFELKA